MEIDFRHSSGRESSSWFIYRILFTIRHTGPEMMFENNRKFLLVVFITTLSRAGEYFLMNSCMYHCFWYLPVHVYIYQFLCSLFVYIVDKLCLGYRTKFCNAKQIYGGIILLPSFVKKGEGLQNTDLEAYYYTSGTANKCWMAWERTVLFGGINAERFEWNCYQDYGTVLIENGTL